ncbi:MAG TPA: manganese efflux pump MntP family protein [Dehalococcoidales bacterium]
MEFLSVFLIALGLSADCFAVALSASIANRNHSPLQVIKVSFSFGFFQALMPVIGWLAGKTIVDFIASFDHWVAFGLLVFVGGKMLWEAFHHEKDEKPADISRGLLLLTLSIATSLDALAVGLAFAFEDVNIWLASPTIGITSFAISALGFLIGTKVGKIFGKRAEVLGGLILIGIGIRILLEHLVG